MHVQQTLNVIYHERLTFDIKIEIIGVQLDIWLPVILFVWILFRYLTVYKIQFPVYPISKAGYQVSSPIFSAQTSGIRSGVTFRTLSAVRRPQPITIGSTTAHVHLLRRLHGKQQPQSKYTDGASPWRPLALASHLASEKKIKYPIQGTWINS